MKVSISSTVWYEPNKVDWYLEGKQYRNNISKYSFINKYLFSFTFYPKKLCTSQIWQGKSDWKISKIKFKTKGIACSKVKIPKWSNFFQIKLEGILLIIIESHWFILRQKSLPSNGIVVNIDLSQASHHFKLIISTLSLYFFIFFPNLTFKYNSKWTKKKIQR